MLRTSASETSIRVEDQRHTLQDPVTDVHIGLDVGDKDLTFAHRVLSVLGHVDRRLDRAAKLESVGFDGDDADEGHLDDELLGILVVQAVLLDAPLGTLQEQALDVSTRIESLGDLGWVALLGYFRVQETLIERP